MHDSAVFRSMHTARFEAEPAIYVAPGRVNLIGEHTDYAEGFVMPAAINFATLAGISPRGDGKIAIFSENFGQVRTFDAGQLPSGAAKHWTDYPLGVVATLAGEGHQMRGFDGDSGRAASYQKACGKPSKTTRRASTPACRKARCKLVVPLSR